MNVAIIGGGASGFFSAISVKKNYPDADVVIFEKSKNLLSKVKLTGGGRCNLTNASRSIKTLSAAYPRGEKLLKSLFREFDNTSIMYWFESRGVPLVTQDDNCVFPKSQNSESITNCLINEAEKLGVNIVVGKKATKISSVNDKLEISFFEDNSEPLVFDKVVVTAGGSPQEKGLDWLKVLNHSIETPVPSLFTFNMPNEPITELMGIVVENALVGLQGTKLNANGALLITHWGMSGPAILKLSSLAARILNEKNYEFKIRVSWVNEYNNELIMNELKDIIKENQNKILANYRAFNLSERLWLYLLNRCELPENKKWNELGKKGLNKLVNVLTNDIYSVKGKTKFKEEFVTCGGISLDSINPNTLESKVCKNLYFAGEVLDIDGITGGYNLQAAWTTGFVAGKLL